MIAAQRSDVKQVRGQSVSDSQSGGGGGLNTNRSCTSTRVWPRIGWLLVTYRLTYVYRVVNGILSIDLYWLVSYRLTYFRHELLWLNLIVIREKCATFLPLNNLSPQHVAYLWILSEEIDKKILVFEVKLKPSVLVCGAVTNSLRR